MKNFIFSKKGVGFTEVIVSALVVTIVFSGISVMFMNAVRQFEKSSDRLSALYLASEGLEILKNSIVATSGDWRPNESNNWSVLRYWKPDSAVFPDLRNSKREFFIKNVSGNNYLRCIDMKVTY